MRYCGYKYKDKLWTWDLKLKQNGSQIRRGISMLDIFVQNQKLTYKYNVG